MADAPKFTPEVQDSLVAFAEMAINLPDACRELGISVKTAKRWLLNGKRDPEGAYGEFYKRIEAARERAEGDGLLDVMTAEELLRVTSRAARKGSVPAMKLMWEILGKRPAEEDDGDSDGQDEDVMKDVDELASRRASRN